MRIQPVRPTRAEAQAVERRLWEPKGVGSSPTRATMLRAVAQVAARLNGVQEAAGSSPASPTTDVL